jgi:hypothetical protein
MVFCGVGVSPAPPDTRSFMNSMKYILPIGLAAGIAG